MNEETSGSVVNKRGTRREAEKKEITKGKYIGKYI